MMPIKKCLFLALFIFFISAAATMAMPDTGAGPTVIQGVHSAGTVRVNNLANLEAVLNIAANLAEIFLPGLGLYLIVKTFKHQPKPSGKVVAGLARGLALIAAGLMTPGIINWLIASSRDAPLCGGIF